MASLLKTNKEFIETYNRYVSMVYRLCYSFMKNSTDAEDMTQETFLRLLSSGKQFENEKHEKAWLIVTASNLCKDALRKWWRREESLEDHYDLAQETDSAGGVMEAILALPKENKTAVYMYYYEGYTTVEIARYLNCPESTVRSRLLRAKRQLKMMLGGERA